MATQKYLTNPPAPKPAKLDALERACRERTPIMVQVLESIALDTTADKLARIKAAQVIMEHGYGKPMARITQDVNVNLPADNSLVIEHIEDAQKAAEMTARIAEYCKMQIPFANWPEDVQLASNFLQGIEP